MGKVTILSTTTHNPIELIGERAGICWGANIEDKDKNYKRGLECIENNHGRTLEFVNLEMILDGYSARVIREWYTHIGGAPTRLQASTRYIDYGNFEYVVPESIEKDDAAKTIYTEFMRSVSRTLGLLELRSIPREDTAMILPLGMTTKIVDKRNLRNLIDMSRQRLCTRAYKEYRTLMKDIMDQLKDYDSQWAYIVEHYLAPKCEVLGYCPEKYGCGRKPKRGETENKNG